MNNQIIHLSKSARVLFRYLIQQTAAKKKMKIKHTRRKWRWWWWCPPVRSCRISTRLGVGRSSHSCRPSFLQILLRFYFFLSDHLSFHCWLPLFTIPESIIKAARSILFSMAALPHVLCFCFIIQMAFTHARIYSLRVWVDCTYFLDAWYTACVLSYRCLSCHCSLTHFSPVLSLFISDLTCSHLLSLMLLLFPVPHVLSTFLIQEAEPQRT